jgi:hypothetical protein
MRGHHYEDPGQGSIAYGDMAAIQIQDPRAQSGRATVARPKQTQPFASSVYGAKHIESETTQTECLCLDEKEASELERELEVEALNHLL